jgi:hypothetical protein
MKEKEHEAALLKIEKYKEILVLKVEKTER